MDSISNTHLVPQNRYIDSASSGNSLSDHETKLHVNYLNNSFSEEELQKDLSDPKKDALLSTPETREGRMSRFKLSPDLLTSESNKQVIGSIVTMNQIMILVQHVGTILNIGNLLFVKIENQFEILGEIEDVLGSIEAPLYYIKTDWYSQHQMRVFLTARVPVFVEIGQAKYITNNDIERMVSEKGTDSVFGDNGDMSDEDKDMSEEDFENGNQGKRETMDVEEGEMQAGGEGLERVCEIEGVEYRIPSIFAGKKKIKESKGRSKPRDFYK